MSVFLAFSAGVAILEGQAPDRRSNQEPKQPSKAKFKTLEGVVSKFLFGPDEVIHGLLIDDGTRVRWPQEITYTFTKIVNVGDKVKASGWLQKSPSGEMNLEVRTLTNLTNRKTASNYKAPPPANDKKTPDR
jgi:hypothetical protein